MVVVVPVQVYAAEDFAVMIDGNIIVFLKRVDKVLCVGVADKFDAKVVNN